MATSSGFVLVHGSFHDHHTWQFVTPLLEAAGHSAVAIDLPGSGIYANYPSSYLSRPVNLEQFAVEPSLNADVTQEERTEAVISTVRDLNASTECKAGLVGHSLGGLTALHVAEAIPEELSAVVFLSSLLLPYHMKAADLLAHESMARRLVPQLYYGDYVKTGVMRIDPKSDDVQYRKLVKESFYEDVSEERFRQVLAYLSPDEPAQVLFVPSPVTKSRFGTVPRYYIHCLQDKAIPIEAQREVVELMDAAMENETITFSLNTSHSPFYSKPEELAEVLNQIADEND